MTGMAAIESEWSQTADKHLRNTKLYSVEFSRTEMMSDPSNYHREYEP